MPKKTRPIIPHLGYITFLLSLYLSAHGFWGCGAENGSKSNKRSMKTTETKIDEAQAGDKAEVDPAPEDALKDQQPAPVRDDVWPEPTSSPGSEISIGGIFDLLPTAIAEVFDDAAGVTYCNTQGNLGHIYRLKQGDRFEYKSCLGRSLDIKDSKAAPSFYKAFQTPPTFFRVLKGYVHITRLNDSTLKYSCYRLPEGTIHEGELALTPVASQICGAVFAFKIDIPDTSDLKSATVAFTAGAPVPVTLGEVK
jgi:hypothetical protein